MSVTARPSSCSTGSSAGVFSVVGMPRATTTERALLPESRTLGGSGMRTKMVACCLTRLVPVLKSSVPSQRNSGLPAPNVEI